MSPSQKIRQTSPLIGRPLVTMLERLAGNDNVLNLAISLGTDTTIVAKLSGSFLENFIIHFLKKLELIIEEAGSKVESGPTWYGTIYDCQKHAGTVKVIYMYDKWK